MHKPKHMPLAEAASVGMSDEGLAAIDELFQEKIVNLWEIK